MAGKQKRHNRMRPGAVREGDVEPYTALRWVGTLFKAAAVFLAVAILAEFIAGVRFEGTEALPVLLGELARTVVIAVVLWGAGDLVRLLIDMGHDMRADRILLGRIASRLPARAPGAGERPSGPSARPEPGGAAAERGEAAD